MNRFEIIKDIDEGAFGFVQMAKNKETGEIVAIKKIKKKYNSWDECMNLREIRSLKKLKHPNVIKLKEVFKLEQELFLVFEYARTNLFRFYSDEFKDKGKSMPEQLIKSIIFQAVSALVYIHKLGFFHRDMKPENLLITDRQVLKIADFGLAREIRSSPPYTEYVSTRWYRSPEILLKSTNYNSPVDIWALGCIMAELYMNAPLFNGASETDQMAKICCLLGHPGKVWPDGLRLASQTGFVFPNNPAQNLEDVIGTASPLAVDMIRSMLNYDSSKRPTAVKLLQHPYFTQSNSSGMVDMPPEIKIERDITNAGKQQTDETRLVNLGRGFLGGQPIKKSIYPSRNLLNELEDNWREETFSSQKGSIRNPLTPKSKNRMEYLQKGPLCGNDLTEFQFQKKLDSMFPDKEICERANPTSIFCNQTKQKDEFEENKIKANMTAKKRQMDVELEELERQILATKKKFASPMPGHFNYEKRDSGFEESAVSRKKLGFGSQSNSDNTKRLKAPSNSLFNDQLEELLTCEQRILEQKSIKNFEPKGNEQTFLRKNGAFAKIGGVDNQLGLADDGFYANMERFKNGTKNKETGCFLQAENMQQGNFNANGFQPIKPKIEATKVLRMKNGQF